MPLEKNGANRRYYLIRKTRSKVFPEYPGEMEAAFTISVTR
jgi:hypothetical protein